MGNEGKSVVEEIKYEEGQQNLTEAQIQSIANEALSEVNKPAKEDEWNNPADEQNKDQAADDKSKEEAEAKTKHDAEVIEKEEKEKKDKAEADAKLKVEEEAKAKLDPAAKKDNKVEDKPFQIPAENRAKIIEELALKESLTLDEAEEQIAKDEATVNKYKNNPVEMARALRHTQRESDKAKAELEATRKAANNPPVPVINNIRDYVEQNLAPIKDKVIEAYRKEYPELSEGQEDNYIYGLVKKDATDRALKVLEENKSKLVGAAKEKRANLILGLSEQDKTFLPDIKAIIDRTDDRQIMAKDYDIKYVIEWAKGKQFEKAVKEAEDRGFKRGQEQAKIIGEKLPGGGNNNDKGKGSAKTPTLTDEQKERAQNMFDIPQMTDEEKYAAYIETYPDQFKK